MEDYFHAFPYKQVKVNTCKTFHKPFLLISAYKKKTAEKKQECRNTLPTKGSMRSKRLHKTGKGRHWNSSLLGYIFFVIKSSA